MKLNKTISPPPTETIRERLTRMGGFDVGEVMTDHFLSASGANALQIIEGVLEVPMQFPRNVPMKQVEVLFKAPYPMEVTHILNHKKGHRHLLAVTGLN